MNLIQKMGVFNTRLGFGVRSLRLNSLHNKLVKELKKVIKEDAGIDLSNSTFHLNELPTSLSDKDLLVDFYGFVIDHDSNLTRLLKEYKDAVESFVYGSRKVARKTDNRIEKAKARNSEEDVSSLEEEQKNYYDWLNEFMDDYEYYYNVYNLISLKLVGRKNTDLALD